MIYGAQVRGGVGDARSDMSVGEVKDEKAYRRSVGGIILTLLLRLLLAGGLCRIDEQSWL